jgi:hypothetical protein
MHVFRIQGATNKSSFVTFSYIHTKGLFHVLLILNYSFNVQVLSQIKNAYSILSTFHETEPITYCKVIQTFFLMLDK